MRNSWWEEVHIVPKEGWGSAPKTPVFRDATMAIEWARRRIAEFDVSGFRLVKINPEFPDGFTVPWGFCVRCGRSEGFSAGVDVRTVLEDVDGYGMLCQYCKGDVT